MLATEASHAAPSERAHNDKAAFGAYIRELRRGAGLTLSDMATRARVSMAHYAHVELGDKAPFPPERWDALVQIGAEPHRLLALSESFAQTRVEERGVRGKEYRAATPAGHPRSTSWDDLAWEEDDWCWYAVVHHPDGLGAEQIGELLGLTAERVRQIEQEALTKLRANQDARDALEDSYARAG